MNAIEMLEAQHRELEQLFESYGRLDDAAGDQRRQLFDSIADKLAVHTTLEEQVFYPAVYEEDAEDALREALDEHLGIKRLIAGLLDLSTDDPQFSARIRALEAQVRRHVEGEEGTLFPRVKGLYARAQLLELAVQMEACWRALEEEGEPRERLPKETSRTPQLH